MRTCPHSFFPPKGGQQTYLYPAISFSLPRDLCPSRVSKQEVKEGRGWRCWKNRSHLATPPRFPVDDNDKPPRKGNKTVLIYWPERVSCHQRRHERLPNSISAPPLLTPACICLQSHVDGVKLILRPSVFSPRLFSLSFYYSSYFISHVKQRRPDHLLFRSGLVRTFRWKTVKFSIEHFSFTRIATSPAVILYGILFGVQKRVENVEYTLFVQPLVLKKIDFEGVCARGD